MNVKIKRGSYKVTWNRGKKLITRLYPIASRYEDGKLMAFSFMTELKGK